MSRVLTILAAIAALGLGGWFAWGQLTAAPTEPNHQAELDIGDVHKGDHGGRKAGEDGEEHASEAKVINLTAAQRQEAGIVVEIAALGPLPKVFRAPGEVRTNDYSTHTVTARYQAIVVERKAKLNDKVAKGQALATLFSSEMAVAQTELVLAEEEYRRVQALKRDFVPARRYSEVETKRRETRAKLATFGLASEHIDALARTGHSGLPSGQFDIVAPQAGTIVSDDFRLGTVVEPGKVLFLITDPDNVWIEAHVSPTIAAEIAGDMAKVHAGEREIGARVVQVQQQIDETTRTVGVRLNATSVDGALKPGLFVDVELYGKSEQVMSLPTDAILRGPDGDWTVYVENAKGQLEPKEVKVLHTVGARTVISGVAPGTKVVSRGAFFVMAEAAKAGFDPHNH